MLRGSEKEDSGISWQLRGMEWDRKRSRNSFVGLVLIFSDKTLTTRKSTTLIAYTSHSIFSNLSLRTRQCVMDNGHTLVVLLPFCCSQDVVKEEGNHEGNDISVYWFTSSNTLPLKRGVNFTGYLHRREKRIRVFHVDMRKVVSPLQECELEQVLVEAREVVERICVLLLVSYCSDIPGRRDLWAVQHDIAVKGLCVWYIFTGEDIINGRRISKRSLKDTTMVICRYKTNLKKSTLKFRDEEERAEKGNLDGGRDYWRLTYYRSGRLT